MLDVRQVFKLCVVIVVVHVCRMQYIYIYIYVHVYVCMCKCICAYMCIYTHMLCLGGMFVC